MNTTATTTLNRETDGWPTFYLRILLDDPAQPEHTTEAIHGGVKERGFGFEGVPFWFWGCPTCPELVEGFLCARRGGQRVGPLVLTYAEGVETLLRTEASACVLPLTFNLL
jgi:hypothetical protein